MISSRFEQAAVAGSPGEGPFPRFGGPRNACPGCKKAVSPMERGVIPGPQGTRWHSSCLVCGGKKSRPVSWYGGREEKGKPGCGKKLDSAAKSDGEGGVWCRECIVSFRFEIGIMGFTSNDRRSSASSRLPEPPCSIAYENHSVAHLYDFGEDGPPVHGDDYHRSPIHWCGRPRGRKLPDESIDRVFGSEPNSEHQPNETGRDKTQAKECDWHEEPQ